MKPFLKRDLPSVAFVISLTIIGVTMACIALYAPTGKVLFGLICTLIGSIFTAMSLYFTIANKLAK